MKKPRRYSMISPRPSTPEETARVDAAARAADERWERDRAAAGRMTDATAEREAEQRGWHARRQHSCDRTKTGRAVRIRATCIVWTKVGTYTIPGFGSGLSMADAVYAPTWEKAFKLAACRAKLREINRRAMS